MGCHHVAVWRLAFVRCCLSRSRCENRLVRGLSVGCRLVFVAGRELRVRFCRTLRFRVWFAAFCVVARISSHRLGLVRDLRGLDFRRVGRSIMCALTLEFSAFSQSSAFVITNRIAIHHLFYS